MSRADPSPAHVIHCIEELLDTLCEVHAMARAGQTGVEFVESLRFANLLLDIINDSIAEEPAAAEVLDEVRERVRSVSALFPSSRTVH
jgi:hypothetical protein